MSTQPEPYPPVPGWVNGPPGPDHDADRTAVVHLDRTAVVPDQANHGPDQGEDQADHGPQDRVAVVLDQAQLVPGMVRSGAWAVARTIARTTDQLGAMRSPGQGEDETLAELRRQHALAYEKGDLRMVREVWSDLQKRTAELADQRNTGPDHVVRPADRTWSRALAVVLLVVLGLVLAGRTNILLGPLVLVLVLAVLGRTSERRRSPEADQPVVRLVPDHPADHERTKPNPLTPELVGRALSKAHRPIEQGGGVQVSDQRIETNGWSCLVELPDGTTADDILKARPKIAGTLSTSRDLVLLTPDPSHEGRLRLQLCERDPLRGEPLFSPLIGRTEPTDVFGALPFGHDVAGELVTFPLLWTNWLVGAIPRQGKSATARHMVLTAGLDYNVLPITADPQGLGIWSPLRHLGPYVVGRSPEAMAEIKGWLKLLVDTELDRRQRVMDEYRESHPRAVRESKFTREMIRDRSLRTPWIVVTLDECDFYLADGDIASMLDELTRRGPAFGISVILATQKPDANVIPTIIRDNIAGRFCLSVQTPQASDMILGAGSATAGYSGQILRPGVHVGAGWLRVQDAYTLVRGFYLDDGEAEDVALQCAQLRKLYRPEMLPEAGGLRALISGRREDLDPQVLLDLREVFRQLGDAGAVATVLLRDRLGQLAPDRWLGLKSLPAILEPYGLRPTNAECMHFDGIKKTSCVHLSELLAALRQCGIDTESGEDFQLPERSPELFRKSSGKSQEKL